MATSFIFLKGLTFLILKMSYSVVFCLLSVIWVTQGQGTVNVNHPNLKFIGVYRNPLNVSDTRNSSGGKPAAERVSYYFASQNAAGFATADNDCKAQLGNDAHLVYIETKEELKDLTEYLSASDVTNGATHWIGGMYDADKKKFVWLNGVEFGSWVPWDDGYPDTQTALTRVSTYFDGSATTPLKFRTQFNTVSNRYICEL